MAYRLLVVDDEELVREGLKVIIERLGIIDGDIFTACNGVEALKLYNEFMPQIIITDIRMPEMDGLKLIQRIRENGDSIVKIAVLSGYGDFNYARTAMQYGVSEYLLKPVNRDEIANLLNKLLERIEHEDTMTYGNYEGSDYILTDWINEMKEYNDNESDPNKDVDLYGVTFQHYSCFPGVSDRIHDGYDEVKAALDNAGFTDWKVGILGSGWGSYSPDYYGAPRYGGIKNEQGAALFMNEALKEFKYGDSGRKIDKLHWYAFWDDEDWYPYDDPNYWNDPNDPNTFDDYLKEQTTLLSVFNNEPAYYKPTFAVYQILNEAAGFDDIVSANTSDGVEAMALVGGPYGNDNYFQLLVNNYSDTSKTVRIALDYLPFTDDTSLPGTYATYVRIKDGYECFEKTWLQRGKASGTLGL